MDRALVAFLDELARFGEENDARETERPKRMLNITPDTGRLLWILVQAARATRILEVGTSDAYSTIWLADAARATGGRFTSSSSTRTGPAMRRTSTSPCPSSCPAGSSWPITSFPTRTS
jgi:predicted O-methyltransferase YrrM